MDAALNRFIGSLRRSGIGVSPSEALDAMRALACVGLHQREPARDALRATLIKSSHDLPLFELLFQLFFGGLRPQPTPLPAEATAGAALPEGKRLILDSEDEGIPLAADGDAAPRDSLRIQPGDLAHLARTLAIRQAAALLDPLLAETAQRVHVRSVGAGARPGALSADDTLPTLDADVLLDAIIPLLVEAAAGDGDDGQSVAEAIAEQLPDDLRRALEHQLEIAAESRRSDPAAPPPAATRPFSESERREMEEIVRRLRRRLKGARTYRRVVSHHGRIHVGRTLRRSLAFDGIPFAPVVTGPHKERPRLVLLCDISLSVRTTARFALHLVYSLHALFDSVRSFVFVSDLADVSQHFERFGIDDAISSVFSERIIDCEANSNYGRAFAIFQRRHLAAVSRETTVIILGDGRGNRHPPNVAALEEIRRRAKRLIWLTPESRGSWGLGGSDMPLYASVAHRTEVVRNLTQLGKVVDGLIGSEGGGRHHG